MYIDGNVTKVTFKWVKNKSQFNKTFKKNYNEDAVEGYFLEVDIYHPENLHIYYFYLKQWKLGKLEN